MKFGFIQGQKHERKLNIVTHADKGSDSDYRKSERKRNDIIENKQCTETERWI